MGNFIDLTGKVFDRWTVLSRVDNSIKDNRVMWLCKCTCGTIRSVGSGALRFGASRSCGCTHKRKGSDHLNWRGGRKKQQGYVYIYKPDHPNAYKAGYVLEHIDVMSEILGRPLDKGETVHHKNGIKNDNRPENLELWASGHPYGQRVSDLLVWAKEIIAKYD